jgi:hypothetical protein
MKIYSRVLIELPEKICSKEYKKKNKENIQMIIYKIVYK